MDRGGGQAHTTGNLTDARLARFHFEPAAVRIIFGPASICELPGEVRRLGFGRAVIISSSGRAEQAAKVVALLDSLVAGQFANSAAHVPIETVVAAHEEVQRVRGGCLIAIGGGSAIDLAKVVSLRTSLPIIAVPTTYSGAEMTASYGLTEDGTKKTGRDPKLFPRTVIYDPELTLGLPVSVSVASAMNAIAHCVEALYASDRNPLTSLMAQDGIRVIAQSLPVIAASPGDCAARADMMYGAWLGGVVVGNAGVALHHRLCHVLGGMFGLPHAETHTALLPHVVKYNAPDAAEAVARVKDALGTESAAVGLFDLASSLGAEMSLAKLGLNESVVNRVTAVMLETKFYNPRIMTEDNLNALLSNALQGHRPED